MFCQRCKILSVYNIWNPNIKYTQGSRELKIFCVISKKKNISSGTEWFLHKHARHALLCTTTHFSSLWNTSQFLSLYHCESYNKKAQLLAKNLLQTVKPCIQRYLCCNRKKDAKNLISLQKKWPLTKALNALVRMYMKHTTVSSMT